MTTKEKAISIVHTLQIKGFEAVFAGGAVRDMLMNIEPHDYDIATSATPDQVKDIFLHTIPVGESFGVIIVMLYEEQFEVATFRTDSKDSDGRRPDSVEFSSMEEDAKRRDLTINGLFYNPIIEQYYDFVKGMQDIRDKVIRFIGDPNERIKEDKLRMLRAIRFASKKDWCINSSTAIAIRSHILTSRVSKERIKEELEKMLLLPKPSYAFYNLLMSGLLQEVLPEINDLYDIPQSPIYHSEGNVFNHTLIALNNAREVSDDPIVLWATLLHDVGKLTATFTDENGKIHSHGHEKAGVPIAKKILERLKFSNKDSKMILDIVANHMRIKHSSTMRESKLKMLIASDYFDRLLIVSKADSQAAIPADKSFNHKKLDYVKFISDYKKSFDDSIALPTPILNGEDLIALGMKPGPVFKEILDGIYEIQLEKDSLTKEEAIEIVVTGEMLMDILNKEE